MNAFIFCADIYCEKCGESFRELITHNGNAPADPENEYSYDSEYFPKGPFADGGGEADTPQHCGNGGLCLDPTVIGGEKYGKFLENDLTHHGVENVREMHREGPTAVTEFWMDFYESNGYPDIRPKRWVIEDWAGNRKFHDKVFATEDDANAFLMAQFPDDDDLGEFCPCELEGDQ